MSVEEMEPVAAHIEGSSTEMLVSVILSIAEMSAKTSGMNAERAEEMDGLAAPVGHCDNCFHDFLTLE